VSFVEGLEVFVEPDRIGERAAQPIALPSLRFVAVLLATNGSKLR
jgi:hypothetical protein